jgi:uncharacterized protein (TIGR02453 family)
MTQEQTQRIVKFLNSIHNNNNKPFMDQNREEYQECKAIWTTFIDELISYVHSIDSSIGLIDTKNTMFRINKDLRFSPSTPYNSHFSAFIAYNGKKSYNAGYYIKLDHEGNLTIGGGLWQPKHDLLTNVRKYLTDDKNHQLFKKILNKKNITSVYKSLEEHRIIRVPIGFEDFRDNAYIYYKSYILSSQHNIIEDYKDISELAKTNFKIISPFIILLNKGIYLDYS